MKEGLVGCHVIKLQLFCSELVMTKIALERGKKERSQKMNEQEMTVKFINFSEASRISDMISGSWLLVFLTQTASYPITSDNIVIVGSQGQTWGFPRLS